jgi:chemotaxis protein methyltransferase CheR
MDQREMGTRTQDRRWKISASDALIFARIAKEQGGLDLDGTRLDFFSSRLGKVVLDSGTGDARGLIARSTEPAIQRAIVEALTTHTTSFFREQAHYTWLAKTGLSAIEKRTIKSEDPLTIWSAACSTGAELWSAGMTLSAHHNRPGGRRHPVRLIGTDLSHKVLNVARGATYREDDVIDVPIEFQHRWFLASRTTRDGDGRRLFRIVPEMRALAEFSQANLLAASSLPSIRADVAFLRNVLIYFSPADRKVALANVVSRLRPGGFLLTGHAERLEPAEFGLEAVAPSTFKKVS